jgi:hypothetical protein
VNSAFSIWASVFRASFEPVTPALRSALRDTRCPRPARSRATRRASSVLAGSVSGWSALRGLGGDCPFPDRGGGGPRRRFAVWQPPVLADRGVVWLGLARGSLVRWSG